MINPFTQINWSPTEKDIRRFGLTLFIGFAVIAALLALISHWRCGCVAWKPAFILLAAGAAVYGLTAISPTASLPVYYLWFFLSACVGFVISNLILVIFYYLLFSPFSIIVRACSGRDPLHLKKATEARSYWRERAHKRAPASYYKQY